ncbi:MAG: hypothetical protein FRX49_10429 [Trebouxia sp. A1-2]|nr:MAG: hypothetical protein FRX49_10429 [Trebouxia sp. A1-2]
MDWPTSEPMRPINSCSSSPTGCLKLVSDWLRMVLYAGIHVHSVHDSSVNLSCCCLYPDWLHDRIKIGEALERAL